MSMTVTLKSRMSSETSTTIDEVGGVNWMYTTVTDVDMEELYLDLGVVPKAKYEEQEEELRLARIAARKTLDQADQQRHLWGLERIALNFDIDNDTGSTKLYQNQVSNNTVPKEYTPSVDIVERVIALEEYCSKVDDRLSKMSSLFAKVDKRTHGLTEFGSGDNKPWIYPL